MICKVGYIAGVIESFIKKSNYLIALTNNF